MQESSSAQIHAAQKSPRSLPIVAIVGRPNAGKSTLFNRIIGERKAIVDDLPGVTRDRNYAETEWAGRRYLLVDTGGIEWDAGGDLEASVQAQSRLAVAEADIIIFLFDGKAGLNPLDREAVNGLRKAGKPVFFAVNKLDSRQRADNLYEFYALGIDQLYSISAEHGLGIPDLMDEVVRLFPAESTSDEVGDAKTEENAEPLRIAVVGRPNVGKSTLINRLLGFERSVVDATPGTTRDSLDTPFELLGEPCILIDTAGIRRKARIDDRIERFSVSRFASGRGTGRSDHSCHRRPRGRHRSGRADLELRGPAAGKPSCLAVNNGICSRGAAAIDKYRDEVKYRLSLPGLRTGNIYICGDRLRRQAADDRGA
jgi:GTP-binding protein